MIARDAPRALHASAHHGAPRLHTGALDAHVLRRCRAHAPFRAPLAQPLIHLKKNAIGDDGANALGRAISAGRLPIRARWLAVRSQGAKRVQCRCPRRPGRTASIAPKLARVPCSITVPVKRHRGEPGHTTAHGHTDNCTGKKTPGGAGTHITVPVKRHRGEPGHTRDTRTHKGTRTAQTSLTTVQTHQQHTTRKSARRPKPRPTQQPQARSRPHPAADSEEAAFPVYCTVCLFIHSFHTQHPRSL